MQKKKTCRLEATWQCCWKANCESFRRPAGADGDKHLHIHRLLPMRRHRSRNRVTAEAMWENIWWTRQGGKGDEHPFTSVHFRLFEAEPWSRFKHFRCREFSQVGKTAAALAAATHKDQVGKKQDYYPILRSFAWPIASDCRDSGLFFVCVCVWVFAYIRLPSLRS